MTDVEFLDHIESQFTNKFADYVDMPIDNVWRLENLADYGIPATHLPGTNSYRITTYTLSNAISHARDNTAHAAVKALLR